MSLFQDLNFLVLVTDAAAQEKQASATLAQLKDNGGNTCKIYDTSVHSDDWQRSVLETKQQFYKEFCQDGTEIHFIVAKDSDFPFYKACAFDLLIPVLTPQWVTDSLASNKLAKTTKYSPNPLHVLREYEFYISKYTFSDNEHFFYTQLITLLGGSSSSVLSANIDFIVSRSYMDPAIQLVLNSDMDNHVKFVFPLWLLSCAKTGVAEPVEPHLLTSKSMKPAQKWDAFHKKPFVQQCNALEKRTYYLDPEMKLDGNIRRFVADFISHMGGKTMTAKNSNKQTTFITCELHRAVHGKQSANLLWLFDVFRLKEYVEPDSKILYKPFRYKIFDNQVNVLNASYSMYFGYQRLYISLLIEKLGGTVSTDFSKKNNFLICQIPRGRKYNTASTLWKRHCTVVNHLWLEDCYLAGEKLDPTSERYQGIPLKSGLKDHINQQPFCTGNILETGSQVRNSAIIESPAVNTFTPVTLQHENTTGSVENEKVISNSIKVLKSGMELLSKTQTTLTEPTDTSQSTVDLENAVPTTTLDNDAIHARNLNEELLSEDRDDNSKRAYKEISEGSQNKKQKTEEPVSLVPSLAPSNEITTDTTEGVAKDDILTTAAEKTLLDAIEQWQGSETVVDRYVLSELPLYDIRAVQTRCLETLSQADRHVLELLGIQIYDDIQDSYHLNTIFAPKLLRTSKFLKSMAFTPLRYALKPSFVTDVLKRVHHPKRAAAESGTPVRTALYVDPTPYGIPEIDEAVKSWTQLPEKLFARAQLHTINIFQDIPGGTTAIVDLLQFHGIQAVNTLNAAFTKTDIAKNEVGPNGSGALAPMYVVIAEKASQVKKLKRMLINQEKPGKSDNDPEESRGILVVEWDWCVKAIQTQQVDYADPSNVKLTTMENAGQP